MSDVAYEIVLPDLKIVLRGWGEVAPENGKTLAPLGKIITLGLLPSPISLPVIMKKLAVSLSCLCVLFLHGTLAAEENAPQEWPALTFHQAPKPLPKGAVTTDWPRFLGPNDQAISPETKLLHLFPATGPRKVWECRIGDSYACPAIAGDRLIYFHRQDGQEQIDCLHAESGRRYWTHAYPVEYKDRYGYANGPRSSAVIEGGLVFTFGVTSMLHALDLKTGTVVWKHDCAAEYGVPKYFFGSGGSPLVMGDVLIVNLGGADRLSVAGFDKKTGSLKWKAPHDWSQSYASPIPAKMGGEMRALIFAGGEGEDSAPSQGGLLSVDPTTGKIDDGFFWRARRYTSVNAASPCLCGPDRVFVTQAYVDADSPCNGGVMLEMTPERKWKARWKAPDLGCHWMTPVFHEGHLYAFSGEKEFACELLCYEAASGLEKWRKKEDWDDKLPSGGAFKNGFKRGSLLRVDGAFLCLGEWGALAWLDLSPQGLKVATRSQPFLAQNSWTLPALSRGLLYVCQHQRDEISGAPPRLICFDLRAEEMP